MSIKNKIVFKTKDENGGEVELMVRRPNPKETRESQLMYAKNWRQNVEGGMMLRANLEAYLRKQGLWTDENQKEREDLENKIREGTRKLKMGGRSGLKYTEAKKLAFDMRMWRAQLRNLLSTYTSLDNNTAEGLADNHRFNYLVSVCTLYNSDGKPYFSGLENFYQRQDQDAAFDASSNLASLMFGIEDDFESKLPENEFLRKYGEVDDKLRLVNKEGKFVDEDGRLVNEDGHYVDKDGNLTDRDGNLVDKDGNFIVEFEDFVDEDGKVVLPKDSLKKDHVTDNTFADSSLKV